MKRLMQISIPLGDGIVYWSAFVIFFSLLILFFSGCATERKQLQKAQNKVIKSGTLSDLCSKFFPVNAAFKNGDTVTKYEYKYLPGQIITRIKNDTSFFERIDTFFKLKIQLVHDTSVIESTAKIDVSKQRELAALDSWKEVMNKNGELNNELLIEKDGKATAIKQRNMAYLTIGAIGLLGLLYLFLRLKRII